MNERKNREQFPMANDRSVNHTISIHLSCFLGAISNLNAIFKDECAFCMKMTQVIVRIFVN